MESDPAANLETEIDLLRRTGQGDRRSFEQLYERFSGVLFSTAYRVLNSPEAAEDVLQDVFIQIWEKAPLYDPERGKPLTWAVTLTRNKAIDRLRSVQRRNRLQDEVEVSLLRRTIGSSLNKSLATTPDERLAARIDLIEQLEVTLPF